MRNTGKAAKRAKHFTIKSADGRIEYLNHLAEKYSVRNYRCQASDPSVSVSVSKFVIAFAEEKNISPQNNGFDQMAEAFTRLAGEPACRQDFDDYVVALGKSAALEPGEVVNLTAAYLAESSS